MALARRLVDAANGCHETTVTRETVTLDDSGVQSLRVHGRGVCGDTTDADVFIRGSPELLSEPMPLGRVDSLDADRA